MGAKLLFTSNAILPIVLLILVGYALKRIKLLPRDFFPLLNKLCFRCCLPCLLFFNVYNVQSFGEIAEYGSVVAFAIVSILAFFVIGFVICVLSTKNSSQRGVILQATYRSNYAIIGISLALSLNAEPKAAAIASVISSVTIPLFNVLATISLTIFSRENEQRFDFLNFAKKIATNPLILGCATGFVVLFVRNFLPLNPVGEPIFTIQKNLPFVYKTLQMLANSASTIALIALGGNFEFSAVARLGRLIAIGTSMRIVVCPLVCLLLAYKFGFSSNEFPALIALYGTPIAVSSVPMAAEMGGDAELAGQLVVWTSLFSAFTLFATIFICANAGIFLV